MHNSLERKVERKNSFEKYLASQTSKYVPRSLSTVGVYIDWVVLLSGHQKQLTQEELALVCFLATKHHWKDEPREYNTQVIHTQIYIQIPRGGLIDSNKVMEDKGRQSLIVKFLETIRNRDEIIMIQKPVFSYLLLQKFSPPTNHLLLANARIRIPDLMDHNSGKFLFSIHM